MNGLFFILRNLRLYQRGFQVEAGPRPSSDRIRLRTCRNFANVILSAAKDPYDHRCSMRVKSSLPKSQPT